MHPEHSTNHAEDASPAPRTAAPAAGAAPAGLARETAQGCRDRAEANLVASNAAMTAHQRTRLETSAASWTTRAAMLQRVEDGIERRARAGADAIEARS